VRVLRVAIVLTVVLAMIAVATSAAYVALALVVLNNIGRRALYYFLDPGTVGTAAVVVNVCVLAGGALTLGYTLLAVNRPVATMR
jgi:hypothetical protein